jgi:hypothetical protein
MRIGAVHADLGCGGKEESFWAATWVKKQATRKKKCGGGRSRCLAVETAMGGHTGKHWHTATAPLYA